MNRPDTPDPKRLLSGPWGEVCVLCIIAAAAGCQLFLPPLIGLADNGDFARIAGRFDIGHTTGLYDERYFYFFRSKHEIDPKHHWDSNFFSSELLLAAIAVQVNT